MRVKVFELRDHGTHIGIFAMSTEAAPGQQYELNRCGFPPGSRSVILGFLDGERESSADPDFWQGRTIKPAHLYIEERFDDLKDGQVIDVRVLLGEATEPAKSDQFFDWSGS